MLTTINKHQWAHHGPSRTQGIWQTFPHSWQLMLFHMTNVPSESTEGYAPLPPQHGPSLFASNSNSSSSLSSLTLLYRPSVLVFQYLTITLSVSSLSHVHLSLSLKWFHSPPCFSPFVHVYMYDSLGFSHLLCHSHSLHHTTPHVKSRREGGGGREEGERGVAESNIFLISFSLETLWAFCLLEYKIWDVAAW